MILNKQTSYKQDLAKKKIYASREFDAPVSTVWKAYTESNLLDKWWAPKPWKAVTKSMDFREGGQWLYYMEGPDGSRHYAVVNYDKIKEGESFTAQDAFSDENGSVLPEMPQMHWHVTFNKSGDATKVDVEITFSSEEDLNKIVEMGFKEGFASAHKNLDELLAS